MHIIIGGAYNGKLKYVESVLQDEPYLVRAATALEIAGNTTANTLVLHTIEQLVADPFAEDEKDLAETIFLKIREISVKFKKSYIILVDIGRGIVPIDAVQRKQRDVLGRLYQLLFQEAQTVTRVWYGLPQTIK